MSNMVLIERLSGTFGEACHWQHGQAAHAEMEARGEGWPFSPSFWLVYLPEFDLRLDPDEEDTGIFRVHYLLHAHPLWEQFRSTGDDPSFASAYNVTVQEVWSEEEDADIQLPRTCQNTGETLIAGPGDVLAAADQHMRLYVDALLSGELHPYDGREGTDEECVAWFTSIREKAEADPDAHLRRRVPPPPSNQTALF